MKHAARLVLAAAAIAVAADASELTVTPVQKVIQLLTAMVEKGKAAKHDEQVAFAGYKQFCDDTTVEKKRAISEAEELIEQLTADIMKYTSDIKQLTKEIAAHEADLDTWNGDIAAATKVRAIEKGDFERSQKDYGESLEALKGAIAVLKKQAKDTPQAAAFLQLKALSDSSIIPTEAQQMIDAFLQQDQNIFGVVSALEVEGPPEANAYEFQSHGIIEMLTKLLDKFTDELTALQKAEVENANQFELLKIDLNAEIATTTTDMNEKKELKAKTVQKKAEAEATLKETLKTKAADEKYLKDLTATCSVKASEFESRQKLRGEELEVLQKAIEIISDSDVSGAADKHLPALLQQKGAALAQLRTDERSPVQMQVSQYLHDRAGQLDSRVLALVSVRAREDPFKKVKKMIQDLIAKLLEEENADAEHKAWCDEELHNNENTRKEKTEAVEMLHAEVDQLTAEIHKMEEQLSELTAAIAELDAAMKKATELREAEKAKNTATIADAKAAQEAVASALVVLKDFYEKAQKATALVQTSGRASDPEIFESDADDKFTGQQGRSKGVIGLLEVIESDFARLEAETSAAEKAAQEEYDEFMTDSAVDKATKETDVEHISAKKQDFEQELQSQKDDLEDTQEELGAGLKYFDKLKPSCINAKVSYEDRVAQRNEEIASLQEALKILSGQDIP